MTGFAHLQKMNYIWKADLPMGNIRAPYIIHVMALLHVVATFMCMLLGINDSLLLTLLTMTMTVLLCLKKQLSAEFAAIVIVLVNVLGFLMGTFGADLLELFIHNEMVVRALATFITTELLGWGVLLFVHLFPTRVAAKGDWSNNIGWMVAAVTIVFMLRVGVDMLLASAEPGVETIQGIMEVSAFCLVFVLYFAARMRNQTDIEREKTHQAEFRYMALKQQVNPHFLFNSLNVLDALVQENSREDASRYVHKLAGMYRYMLQHEGESLVRLSEEMEFTRMYVELMLVRFPKGLDVMINVPEEDLQFHVVPCAVQLLVENATKHNAISEENPLVVDIVSDAATRTIRVSNNRIPRLSPSHSTGLGQAYIRQQYADQTSRVIGIESSDTLYRVTLPLL